MRIVEVEHDLSCFRALKGLLVEFLDGRESAPWRQPVEAIEKVDRRFLILKGIFVSVVALSHSDAIRVMKHAVKVCYFANCFVRTLNWEKVEHPCSHKDWARIHHEQEPRIVDMVRDHPVKILFRIAVGILENSVVHTHGERGDVAGKRRNFNSTIQRCDVGSLKSAPTRSCNVDALWVNLRPRQKIIHCAYAVPNLPPRQICSSEIRQIAQNRVLRAD